MQNKMERYLLFNKFFSGRQPRRMNYRIQRFGDQLHFRHKNYVKYSALNLLLTGYISRKS